MQQIEPQMTRSDAMDTVKLINRAISTAGDLLLKLHNHKGWKALGYKSWNDCVDGEFEASRASVFRHLRIAQVEATLEKSQVETLGGLSDRQAKALSVVEPSERSAIIKAAQEATGLKNPPAEALEEQVNNLPPKQDAKDQEPPKVEKADEIIVKVTKHCSGSKVLDKINGLVGDYMAHWPDNLDALERNLQAHLNRIQKDKPSNVLPMQKASAV